MIDILLNLEVGQRLRLDGDIITTKEIPSDTEVEVVYLSRSGDVDVRVKVVEDGFEFWMNSQNLKSK